jgi:hypothetical protein
MFSYPGGTARLFRRPSNSLNEQLGDLNALRREPAGSDQGSSPWPRLCDGMSDVYYGTVKFFNNECDTDRRARMAEITTQKSSR